MVMIRKSRLQTCVVVFLITICKVQSKISQNGRTQAIQSTLYSPYLDITMCRTVPGLTKSQIDLCKKLPDATMVGLQGLNLAVKECQYQFQGYRWNCSSLSTRGRNPYISAMLQKGYKETAYAYAISSAGVAISVAKACSSGQLMSCGCDNGRGYKRHKTGVVAVEEDTLTGNWKWNGCSHNLKYGIKFSKMFLDSREKADDIHSKINLHNNQVGRMAVKNNMQLKCKCHGMSGSCQLKTCWRAAPDFRFIGKTLKERFKTAILVDQSNLGKKSLSRFNRINSQKRRKPNSRPKQWTPKKNKHKRDLSYDLLYYQKSPNFCDKDPYLDVPGTSGRFCNKTGTGPDSCSTLCCGRGYDEVIQKRLERCKCKFVWCCQVECQTCIKEEFISLCK